MIDTSTLRAAIIAISLTVGACAAGYTLGHTFEGVQRNKRLQRRNERREWLALLVMLVAGCVAFAAMIGGAR